MFVCRKPRINQTPSQTIVGANTLCIQILTSTLRSLWCMNSVPPVQQHTTSCDRPGFCWFDCRWETENNSRSTGELYRKIICTDRYRPRFLSDRYCVRNQALLLWSRLPTRERRKRCSPQQQSRHAFSIRALRRGEVEISQITPII